MSQDLSTFWLDAAHAAIKAGWSEQALPNGFARLVGGPEAEPVVMESRAWSGLPFRTVRTTWMHSPARIEVFNFVAYPWTTHATPIFATGHRPAQRPSEDRGGGCDAGASGGGRPGVRGALG